MPRHHRGWLASWLAVALVTTAGAQVPDAPSNYIVAKVNGEIVTTADVLKEIGPAMTALDRNELLSGLEKERKKTTLWTKAVRDKVEEILALQAARQVGIKVGHQELQREYDTFVKRIGGEDEARRWARERGVTWDEIQATIKRQLTIQKLIMQKIGLGRDESQRRPSFDSFVRPREIRRFYEQNPAEFELEEALQLRQLFLAWSPDRDGTRLLAESLAEQLRRGADFASLVTLYTPGELGRHGGRFPVEEKGGRLQWQWVTRGIMRSEVEAAAFLCEAGQTTAPIETEVGIFIVRVEKHRESRTIPFEEAQGAIRGRLQRTKLNANLARIRAELRKKASVWPPNLFSESQLRNQ